MLRDSFTSQACVHLVCAIFGNFFQKIKQKALFDLSSTSEHMEYSIGAHRGLVLFTRDGSYVSTSRSISRTAPDLMSTSLTAFSVCLSVLLSLRSGRLNWRI